MAIESFSTKERTSRVNLIISESHTMKRLFPSGRRYVGDMLAISTAL